MKTITQKLCICISLLAYNLNCFAQDTIKIPNPLTKDAFDKNIMQDINFMVLGDNNPKQGFSYEYDEKRTELSLSGLLVNFKSSILTIDGSFSVDDGSYIFDNKDGSTKASVSLNYFVPACFGNSKRYAGADDKTISNRNRSYKTNRARNINYLTEKELPKKLLDSFAVLDAIIKEFKFPGYTLEDNEKSDLLKNLKASDPDKKLLLKKLLKYYKKPVKEEDKDYDKLVALLHSAKYQMIWIENKCSKKEKEQSKCISNSYNVPEGFDVETLFNDYDKAVGRLENLDEEVYDKQIKDFHELWISERNTYFGLSTNYQRESLAIYNGTAVDFPTRFVDTKGDLFGITGSFNTVKRYKMGFFYIFRGLATFGRGSNFKDFDKKEYVYVSSPEVLGNGTITEEQKKTGYYNKKQIPYDYGFAQKYETEFYAAYKFVGLYGKIGYAKNDALFKTETVPFETGLIINVQSEKKNVVSILLFVAREDLKVHPDLDTNFGFKIGLPINIRKSNKDKEEDKS